MKSQVLVGAAEFMQALSQQALKATDSLYIQAMTFEGDAAGEQLIDLMVSSPARDKRLLVDSFSSVVISDHFVFGPKYLKDKGFRQEIANTKLLIEKASEQNIQVKFTNPVGPLLWKYPERNHKKMMLVDGEVSFIGGINFSDHNFAWYDMMVEITDPQIGGYLKEDFLMTWEGTNQSRKIALEGSKLFFFNAHKSRQVYRDFFEQLSQAQKSITIISPYISGPIMKYLQMAACRGVQIDLISPAANNKGLMKNYLVRENKKGYFRLRYYPGMLHMKAILVDDEELYLGSSNYDLISYYFEQELVLVSSSMDLVTSFKSRILTDLLRQSELSKDQGFEVFTGVIMFLLKIFCRGMSRIYSFAGMGNNRTTTISKKHV